MRRISRRKALMMMSAPACIAAPQTGGSELPRPVRAVWNLAKAHRESTRTRERVSINGLWRWQPAVKEDAIPESGWGYLRVPESWPGGAREWGKTTFFPHADWAARKDLGSVTAAWQQRELTVPRDWTGRRITLLAPYLNSYAAVYVDGKKAGEMRYPAGELDLTGSCHPGRTHVLSMLVMALPLKGVMLSYNDTASAKQVTGKVARRGVCGDIWLSGTPAGPRIVDVKVETSVRRWQITFDTALAGLDPKAKYMLRAVIHDGEREVERFTSPPFDATDLAGGRFAITEHWRPDKLWDTDAPHQYELRVSLIDAHSTLVDEALPARFGFREFWIEGRDFYLNGTRIYLSAVPLDNGQLSAVSASYEATRATLQRFKSFGINFVYTHNYGCEPGSHISFEEVLRAADDEGVLVSFSQPHFGHYEWTAPDAAASNGYAQHAAFYVRVAQNHPSVICYSTSHNSTGYSEDMNPDMIDGIQNPRDQWALRNASQAMRAEEIIRRIDPSRFVYHHSSGNLGSMHTSNFYANWAPVQEMSDWFEHWATIGVKPLFTCEYSVPFLWDWAMYRGWYKGKREFGSAPAPWEFCVAEWNAQFLGDRSYDIIEAERVNLRWEAEQFRKGRVWLRWDYPQSLNSQVFDERFRVVALHLTDNFRAFRTWGVSATSPWEYGNYWKPMAYERDPGDGGLAIDWDGLQRPGARPAYINEQQAKDRLAFRRSDAEPTAAAQALYRNNLPLLAYLAGKPAAFTSKDHTFLPGETVEKQLIAINNSRRPVGAECEWSLALPRPVGGSMKITLPTGEQQRIPLKFDLPADLAPGRYELRAQVRFATGETQEDLLPLDVIAPLPGPRAAAKIAIFDPKGDSAKLLRAMGVQSTRVDTDSDLSGYDTLIVGKGALSVGGAAPDIAPVRGGLKVIVFEQTGEVLEKRFGFRIAEYGMRRVFARVPGHPLLAGLADAHLHDWRGSATVLPPRLTYERAQQFNYVPTVSWCGIPVTRLWRCGNRGNVASALIEKPACGDFLPVLDCGYSLQYSPLLEFREGAGMVLFCQMDVSGRTEREPAAERLARNVIDYAAEWKAGARRRVAYAGDPAGMRFLQAAGFAPVAYRAGMAEGSLLVAGPGPGQVGSAGPLLAIGLDQKDADALGLGATMTKREHISAYFAPFGAGSPFAGISPAEVHNRDPRVLPLVTGGASIVGNGVLARSEKAVFSQLAPWQWDFADGRMNVKRTYRKVACLTARLLGNLGAAGKTPLLTNFGKPAGMEETRWLDGLYLDVPEEWDDPYRFFRW
jgi:beta-galactosidase/beta-glucuronidase